MVNERANDGCGDASAVVGMAAELFQLASLLVGEENRALRLIESSLSSMEIDPCLNTEAAREQTRGQVVRGALRQLAAEEPGAFSTQTTPGTEANPCIQDDDLESAGITPAQLRSWVDEGDRPELRSGLRAWLENLPAVQRVVFVQRAVLGQGNEAAADLLRESGGEQARGWTPKNVSQTFRLALCSLANSLVHAPVPAVVPV
jgi:hypothetical protein